LFGRKRTPIATSNPRQVLQGPEKLARELNMGTGTEAGTSLGTRYDPKNNVEVFIFVMDISDYMSACGAIDGDGDGSRPPLLPPGCCQAGGAEQVVLASSENEKPFSLHSLRARRPLYTIHPCSPRHKKSCCPSQQRQDLNPQYPSSEHLRHKW
jgi:hypothetical protein